MHCEGEGREGQKAGNTRYPSPALPPGHRQLPARGIYLAARNVILVARKAEWCIGQRLSRDAGGRNVIQATGAGIELKDSVTVM